MDNQSSPLPTLNQLSLLVSTILLAYALTHFVSIPAGEFNLSVWGIIFPIRINFTTLVTGLVAGLTASGTAWLLESHPSLKRPSLSTAIHWLLPSLTALVLMRSINLLPFGRGWWIAALGSGLVLLLVFTAEFVALDDSSRHYLAAEISISALSIVLFLILTISLHASETRLFYRIPLISLAALLVTLRVINLRQSGTRGLIPGVVAFLVIGELAASFHYWPMGSISFGLVLTGPLYALIEVSDILPTLKQDLRIKPFYWPLVILFLSWAIALLI